MARLKYFFLLIFMLSLLPALSQSPLENGLKAHQEGDWTTAIFSLRKALALNEGAGAETLYLLIMSEMRAGEYGNVEADCLSFLSQYPSSEYVPYVQYQRGRCAFYRGEYNTAVLLLSDFCHNNSTHELFSSALYWMAESFYATGDYTPAKNIYERIVSDFSDSDKAAASEYRINTIIQRNREEKLVYLLKRTGEEYLATKENYEKQLKEYKTKGLVELQRQLKDEKEKNIALASEIETLRRQNEALQQAAGGR